MIYTCERHRQIGASAERVWDWLSVPQHVFGLNVFHRSARFPEPTLCKGGTVFIQHRFFGVYDQERLARIRAVRPYFLAWGEFAVEEVDRFPHSQSFTIIPVAAQQCRIVNRLRGKFLLPGAPYWLHPLYRVIGPWILDNENAKIAAACTPPEQEIGLSNCG